MKRFVAGADRSQSTLLPESLDDWVDESNPVRVIDAFVDALNLAELGFDRVKPAVTGRPSYHGSTSALRSAISRAISSLPTAWRPNSRSSGTTPAMQRAGTARPTRLR